MPKVSIITPTYNREKYLKKCIDSVLNQTLNDIEFIIVDDGSTDNTLSLVNSYNDSRIKYFKRENQGIGSSRNFGINVASGDYLVFLDSDDYLAKDAILKMYEKALNEDLDIVISDYNNVYLKGNIIKKNLLNFNNTTLFENPNLLVDINLGPSNKLFRKEIIGLFPENIKYEDMSFVVEAFTKAKKIGKINEPLFYFLVDNISETTVRDKRIFDVFKSLDLTLNNLNNPKYEEIKKELVINKLCNYTIQQRYQKIKKVRNEFINCAFIYMKNIDKNYRKNIYFKKRGVTRSFIEKNKILTKLYCTVYQLIK